MSNICHVKLAIFQHKNLYCRYHFVSYDYLKDIQVYLKVNRDLE